jgi:short-subunit dehydrogenase
MKRIIVTGATSGFGRECVRRFLANGDAVIATGRKLSQRPEVFANERAQYPDRIREMDLDVTDAAQRSLVAMNVGRLDVLVNNAGLGHFGACEFTDEDTARKVFDVNFFGAMALTRDLIPALRQSSGRIINISSVFGFAGFPLTGVYCASKFAMEGWSEALAHELRPHGIDVHIVQPGGHRTGFMSNALRSLAPDDQGLSSIQQRGYQFFQDRLTSRPTGPGAEAVAKAIVKLISRRKAPLRCPVGKDAKAMTFMKAWLPRSLFHAILFKMTKNAFSREAKA